MAKYRKKPVVIDAFQWTGDQDQKEDPEWVVEAIKEGKVSFSRSSGDTLMHIQSFEGIMTARAGDFIIRGVKGELYSCKPDIFEMTYEKEEEEAGIK